MLVDMSLNIILVELKKRKKIMGFSFETTFEVDKEDVGRLLKELFGDDKQYEEQQKRFGEAAVNDALSYFNSKYERDANTPERTWNILETIAVSMYMRGFNRAFEYYIKHEDIFNLEGNGKTE